MGKPTITEFLSTLPPALTRRGPARADDKTLAQTIRRDVALAADTGVVPPECKFSVRISHHGSLIVEFMAWPGSLWVDDYVVHLMDPTTPNPERSDIRFERYTPEFLAARAAITQIANRHNYDRSDTMTDYFDVGYYLDVTCVTVASVAEAAIRRETDQQFAELYRAGCEAARVIGPKATAAACGRAGLEGASAWVLANLIRLAKRSGGVPLQYNKRRGWVAP